jgi:hypothetical protein
MSKGSIPQFRCVIVNFLTYLQAICFGDFITALHVSSEEDLSSQEEANSLKNSRLESRVGMNWITATSGDFLIHSFLSITLDARHFCPFPVTECFQALCSDLTWTRLMLRRKFLIFPFNWQWWRKLRLGKAAAGKQWNITGNPGTMNFRVAFRENHLNAKTWLLRTLFLTDV